MFLSSEKKIFSGLTTHWVFRPFCLSLAIHVAALVSVENFAVEPSAYAVTNQVHGVSIELIPGPSRGNGEERSPLIAARIGESEQTAAPEKRDVPTPPPVEESKPPAAPEKILRPVEHKKAEAPKSIAKHVERPKRNRAKKPVESVAPKANTEAISDKTLLPETNGDTIPSDQAAGRASFGSGQNGGSPDVPAMPDYLKNPPPPYPPKSRASGEEGVVVLSVTIDTLGDVRDLALKKSSSFSRLDNAALTAVRYWKFKPAKLAGLAYESTVDVPVRFVLRR